MKMPSSLSNSQNPKISFSSQTRLWLVHFLFGSSSGLAYGLTGVALQGWMTDVHVDLKVIGVFALVKTPYSFKFLWSPFLDRFQLPFLTRRRAWMVVIQLCMIAALIALGFSDPAFSPGKVAVLAVILSFFGASQDIVVDGYRTESLEDRQLGLATSNNVTGYRIGMIIAGSLPFIMVDKLQIGWGFAFQLMTVCLGLGMVATLLAPEPTTPKISPPKNLKEAVVYPFLDFFKRPNSLWLFVFIIFYKFGDNLASAMTVPYFLSHDYTKTEYAVIAKGVGTLAVIAGMFVGGPIMLRIGIARSLWIFGIGQAMAVSVLIWLASIPKSLSVLSLFVAGDNFAIGLGAAAFSAYLSSITNKKYSATQYALLSSLMAFSTNLLSAPSGWLAEKLGWPGYFSFCVALAVPGILLLLKVAPWNSGKTPAITPNIS